MPKCRVCGKTLKNRYAKTCLAHRRYRPRKERIIHNGYCMVYLPEHPHAGSNGYVREHRVIMEKHIGRILSRKELVHHKNHIPTDNRIDNLMIMTKSEHSTHHGNNKGGI